MSTSGETRGAISSHESACPLAAWQSQTSKVGSRLICFACAGLGTRENSSPCIGAGRICLSRNSSPYEYVGEEPLEAPGAKPAIILHGKIAAADRKPHPTRFLRSEE